MEKDMVRQQIEEFGKDNGLIHEAVVTGRKVGAGREFWTKIVHNKDLFSKVVDLVDRNGYEATTSQKTAQAIMGSSYLGPEAVIEHLGVKYTKKELIKLAEIPLSEDELAEGKDTHIIFAGYSLSILGIRERVAKDLFYSYEDNKNFARKEKVDVRWYWIRKDILPDSTNKTYQEQLVLLTKDEEVPRAVEMVYMTILYYLATGIRLFKKTYARCQDLDYWDDDHVSIGYFVRDGLGINDWWFLGRHSDLGIISSQKFQN